MRYGGALYHVTVTRRGYSQVADVLQQRIEAGEYEPRAQFPTEFDLAKEFGVARSTVRQAMGLLVGRGLVVTIHGLGSFVRDGNATEYGQPKYAQVVSAIREDIRRGVLVAGDRMPSESELCERFSMSRVTVRRALKELEELGMVVSDSTRRRVVAGP
jgi:DNA-binding GntR family transcriptional regulator